MSAQHTPGGGYLTPSMARQVLDIFQFAYPIALFVFFLIAFCTQTIIAANRSNPDENGVAAGPGGKPLPRKRKSKRRDPSDVRSFTPTQKLIFQWISIILCITFLANAVNVVLHVLAAKHDGGWWCGKATAVYIVGSFFVYSLFAISTIDQVKAPTRAHLFTWIIAFLLEVAIFASYLSVYTYRGLDPWQGFTSAVYVVRLLLLIALLAFYWVFEAARRRQSSTASSLDERTSLLPENGTANTATNGRANGYGGTDAKGTGHPVEEDEPGWVRPAKNPRRSWWEYVKGYSVFFPYLWPSKQRSLQVIFIVCFAIVMIQRFTNVLVPYQIGVLIDDLSGENGPVTMPWGAILLYIAFRLLNGGNGFLSQLRSWLWIPINQYSYRELSTASFEHVHGLSLDFHLGKKTGEVVSALGKGNSINNFLEQLTFQFIPMIVDLCVGIGYFLIKFDTYYALVVTIVTFWYIYLTIRMAQWRIDVRRDMTNADRETDGIKNDSMMGYESVKYFNAEDYEFSRYRASVVKFQAAEYKTLYTLSIMNVSQNLLFTSGVLVCCFIGAYQVTMNIMRVGDFVAMVTYLTQLQQPLNYFGSFYRSMQNSMISSERMLELFKEQPTVVDAPSAEVMKDCSGEIKFNNVQFAYDSRKQALHGLDFTCPQGTTTALVGESGGGKSTVFRLLFRFYNPAGGSIEIDGQSVEDITIDSLRRFIGVVPQDTVLFNETLMYNLKYAKQGATDEEVYTACRAASIHDKIMTFPEGYYTKVGERGLRLSGGEKQRVAIARTILKGPPIILLDEATAALDTETEQHIQEALVNLGKNRTMLVIAHRLSTITQADQILVLHEGKVIERGSHTDLLSQKGRYYQMWKKQAEAQKAADKAKLLNDKAEELRRQSKDLSASADFSSTGSTPFGSDGEDEAKKKSAESLAKGKITSAPR